MTSSLDPIFSPKNIAVIGATERLSSVGRTVMLNLTTSNFKGEIYPVNPKYKMIFDRKCYPSVSKIPKTIDLVIIVTPAKTVPPIIAECVEAKIGAAVIISAGFKEAEATGALLEEEILFHSRGKMRIVGPNCLGVMRPQAGLNATFARGMAHSGSIAFLSQSGALCTAVLDLSFREKIGFSAFVSIGSMIDVDWSELIQYFNNDPFTKSILIYMESLGNPKEFISAATKAGSSKPIIILKVGRSPESARAAVSHTGSLVGNDDLFTAVMERCHVLRVDSTSDLFNMANFLAKQPMPKGSNLTIITNAGGPGILATDALIQNGGKLTTLKPEIVQEFDQMLGSHGTPNPIDIRGDASPDQYAKAMEIASKESSSDGILVILTPQDMTDPLKSAEKLQNFAHSTQPLITSWMGDRSVAKGIDFLNDWGIPVFPYPDMASETFAKLALHQQSSTKNENFIFTPIGNQEEANEWIELAKSENRTILSEIESKKIIQAYGIPVVRSEIAKDPQEAVDFAQKIGFPVVLKLFSKTITHKMKVGGVKLDLKDSKAVLQAFDEIYASVKGHSGAEYFQGVSVQPMIKPQWIELLLGSMTDEQLGPAILFGFGGHLVQIMNDKSIGFPPLNENLARKLIEKTKIYQALKEESNFDLSQLEQILIRFSGMLIQHPWIKECDINPLVPSKEGFLALDARIILHDSKLREDELPDPVFLFSRPV